MVPVGIVPFVTSVGVRVKVPPLQIVAVIGLMAGFGSTLTVTVKGSPSQPPEEGVTVYVAVCVVFVEFIRVPLIDVAPPPIVPPVILPVTVGADQV